jgi:hypothetical protein
VLAGAILLGGCSHSLIVKPHGLSDGESGATYVLPYTKYDVTMTWRVAACDLANPKLAFKAEIVQGLADDGAHAYTIDPASLQTLTSIGTFSAKYREGTNMLETISVAAEDRSAAIIGNIVTSFAKLAPLALAPAGGRSSACTPAAEAALALVSAKKPLLDELNAKIGASTAEIARLTAKSLTMGTAIDNATKAALGAEIDKLANLQTQQKALSGVMADALKTISYTRKVEWPDSSAIVDGGPYALDTIVVARWFVSAPRPADIPLAYLQLERAGSFGKDPRAPGFTSSQVAGDAGLRYRIPARGRLVVCTVKPCASSDVANVVAVAEGQVAQLGYVNILPVRNRTFGSTVFSASFTPVAGLATVGYEQKAAPLEGATGALADAAGKIGGVFDPLARTKADADYLEQLKRKRDASAALEVSPGDPNAEAKAALDADTSLLTAQAVNLEAQIKLAELRAKLNP